MGLDAQVIAIGPFSRSVLAALEYSANYYANVTTISTSSLPVSLTISGKSTGIHRFDRVKLLTFGGRRISHRTPPESPRPTGEFINTLTC